MSSPCPSLPLSTNCCLFHKGSWTITHRCCKRTRTRVIRIYFASNQKKEHDFVVFLFLYPLLLKIPEPILHGSAYSCPQYAILTIFPTKFFSSCYEHLRNFINIVKNLGIY